MCIPLHATNMTSAVIVGVPFFIVYISCGDCTTDLNVHQLQYVADHLTSQECRKLVETLHSTQYALARVGNGEHEPDLTCIELLVLWDQTEGRNKTFHPLTHRLRQLGKIAVADKISRTVYHNKAQALQHKFLDDPFKEMIHRDSGLLDSAPAPSGKHSKPREDSFDPLARAKVAFTITGAVCLAVIILMVARRCCPGLVALVGPIVCPQTVLDCCRSCCKDFTVCCERFGTNTKKHLLGAGLDRRKTPV